MFHTQESAPCGSLHMSFDTSRLTPRQSTQECLLMGSGCKHVPDALQERQALQLLFGNEWEFCMRTPCGAAPSCHCSRTPSCWSPRCAPAGSPSAGRPSAAPCIGGFPGLTAALDSRQDALELHLAEGFSGPCCEQSSASAHALSQELSVSAAAARRGLALGSPQPIVHAKRQSSQHSRCTCT